MINYYYQSDGSRPIPTGRIIDIGGANSYLHGKLDALVDIRQPQASARYIFIGDIDTPEVWDDVLQHAVDNGPWDYAVCTHTFEDINNPVYAASRIELIAKAGLIVVPSKYQEFGKFSGNFRGFIHHRWIFDVIDGVLTAFPKINYIEAMPDIPGAANELVIEWSERIAMRQLNDGMPYGTETLSGEEHIKKLYNQLLL